MVLEKNINTNNDWHMYLQKPVIGGDVIVNINSLYVMNLWYCCNYITIYHIYYVVSLS